MWLYEGPGESTRVHPEDLTEKEVGAKIKAITCARDNPRGTWFVPAFHKELSPIDVIARSSVGLIICYPL